MVVRVSKPEINLRDKLNKAEPPMGVHGSQLLRSKSTSETFDLVRAGRRNLIINGDMRIWQRTEGGAVTGATGLKFGPDRWMFEEGCNNLVTVLTRSTDTPLDQGFKYSFQLSPSQAESGLQTGDFAQYMYFVEGYDFAHTQWGTINAKPCTLSFWFKTNMGGQHYVSFNSFSGVDTWGTSIRSTANVWEYHVITVPPPMTGSWNTTNSRGLEIRIGLVRSGSVTQANSEQWYHGGSNYNGFADAHSDWAFNTAHNAYLTGVQLEIGSQATPFEHRPYAEELALCQRYYWKLSNGANNPGAQWLYMIGDAGNLQYRRATVNHPVPMKGSPSVTNISVTNTGSSVGVQFNGTHSTTIYVNGMGNGITEVTNAEFLSEL